MRLTKYNQSVNNIIGRAMLMVLLLSALLAITSLSTLSFSLKDAESVNIAGSLRMQSYRLAYIRYAEPSLMNHYMAQFERSLFETTLADLHNLHTPKSITVLYQKVINEWAQVKPLLLKDDKTLYQAKVKQFVDTINDFVKEIELYSNNKVWLLTIIQSIGFSLILSLAWYTVRYTKKQVVKPLLQLVEAAKHIQDGQFSPKLPTTSPNELGVLAVNIGNMADDLGKLYRNLEQKVQQKTEELSQANKTLTFLHENTQMLQVTELDQLHISQALERLKLHMDLSQARLTLNSEQFPSSEIKAGEAINCDPHNSKLIELPNLGQLQLCAHHPIDQRAAQSFAVILCKALEHNKAILQQQKLLLVEERTSIARELHDSLAQALSYLKIQVTMLKRAVQQQDIRQLSPIIDELQQGLSSAYEQLRELLSTFRLTVKESNLEEAISIMITELQKQTAVELSINYQLRTFSQPANRQIHILQIIREAILNACKHASCNQIIVNCIYGEDDIIKISIIDNGIGFADVEAPLNHYGILIMGERAEKLNGSLTLLKNKPTGTEVCLTFPQ